MKRIFVCSLLLLTALASSSAWAESKNYYASLTTKVADGCSGMGKVYASTSGTEDASQYTDSKDGSGTGGVAASGSGKPVTFYAYAKPETGYEFLGWADKPNGVADYASKEAKWEVKLNASTTKDGTQAYTYYAYFKKCSYDSFSVTYLASIGGSYTVDGVAVGSDGLTSEPTDEVYKPTLVAKSADGYAFNGWYTTTDGGATKEYISSEMEATYSFTAAATVGADFVKSVTVTTAEELLYSLEHDTLMEIPAGTTITIESGTLASGKTLIINGDLFISGTFTNNGTVKGGGRISTYTKQVMQTGANGDTPFETTCVVASYNKKYYKTKIDALSGKISGNTPSCTQQNAARVMRNGAVIAQCVWPKGTDPAVLCCTINASKAVNCITGFMDPCYNTDAAKGMATMKANNKPTAQMLVLLASKELNNSACSNAGILNSQSKLDGNFGTMDLAGSTLTLSPSKINSYSHILLNGGINEKTLLYGGTITCINLSSVTFSSIAPKYNSVINLYDCTISSKFPGKFDTSASGSSLSVINYYSSLSGSSYSTSYFQTDTSHYFIYGGAWNKNGNSPAADRIATNLATTHKFAKHDDGCWYLDEKGPDVVSIDGGDSYDNMDEAFAAVTTAFGSKSSVKLTMVKNATVQSSFTVPKGKTLEIELDGCCITAMSDFVINNGTFLIGDRKGNIATAGGRVEVASGKKFLQNNGTAEVTYGYYTGDVVLNGGEMTTHHGRFTGSFSAASGVTKTTVANFCGGYFDKDISSFLRPGYLRTSGYVGPFPKPVTTKTFDSSGGCWKCKAELLGSNDLALYNSTYTTRDRFKDDEWKRLAEVKSMVQPYLTSYTIDVAAGFDRDITADGVSANVSEPNLGKNDLTKSVEAGSLFRVLSEQLANPTIAMLTKSYQKQYGTALASSTAGEIFKYDVMEFGVSSTKAVDKGTTVNLRVDLCTGANGYDISKLRSVHALMSEYVVLGAGKTNEAMIQPVSGAATFYATIADAVAASPEGGTVKLCNDIDSTDKIVISKAVVIDTNGMEFKGTFEPADYCTMVKQEMTLDVEKALGKKHVTYTFANVATAKINDTFYLTLAKAVEAAADGVTIVLLADNDEELTVSKAITIDTKGFALSGVKAGEGYLLKTEGEKVIVKKDEIIVPISDGDVKVTVDSKWLAEQGLSVDATTEQIQTKLQEDDPTTGLKVWQAYAAGATAPLAITAAEPGETGKMNLAFPNYAPNAKSGVEVKCMLVKTVGELKTEEQIDLDKAEVEIDVGETTPEKPVALYTLKMTFSNANGGEPVESKNTIGVMCVESTEQRMIVPVPWTKIGGEEMDANNLIDKRDLVGGEVLYVYEGENGYRHWRFENCEWTEPKSLFMSAENDASEIKSGDASLVKIGRGKGVWIEFAEKPTEPRAIHLVGQYEEEPLVPEAMVGWNLFSNANIAPADVEDVASAGDTVILPTVAAPIRYTQKDGEWGRYVETVHDDGDGWSYKTTEWEKATGGEIGIGQGYWLHR